MVRRTAFPHKRTMGFALRTGVSFLLAAGLLFSGFRFTYGASSDAAGQPVPFQVVGPAEFLTANTAGPCAIPCWLVITSRQQLYRTWPFFRDSFPSVNFSRYALAATGWGRVPPELATIQVKRVVRVGSELQVHDRHNWRLGIYIYSDVYPVTFVEILRPFTSIQFIDQYDAYGCPWALLDVCQTVNQPPDNYPVSLVQANPPCRTTVPADDYNDVACFGPSSVAKAEALLHAHTIDPSAVVTRLTHLRLHQVIAADWNYTGPRATHWHPYGLVYHYGPIPPPMNDLDFSRHQPSFVNVAETGVRLFNANPQHPILEQALLHLNPAYYSAPLPETIVKGPWEFVARIPHHKLWITVIADGTRSSVRQLGGKILKVLSVGGSNRAAASQVDVAHRPRT